MRPQKCKYSGNSTALRRRAAGPAASAARWDTNGTRDGQVHLFDFGFRRARDLYREKSSFLFGKVREGLGRKSGVSEEKGKLVWSSSGLGPFPNAFCRISNGMPWFCAAKGTFNWVPSNLKLFYWALVQTSQKWFSLLARPQKR